MKVLHVITMLELGGAQQNTLYTCRRLAERGHDVLLAAGPGGMLDSEASRGPFRHVVIPDLVRPVAPLRDLRALLQLRRLVASERPDIVHTHSSKAGALGRLAGRLGGAGAVVHTVHGWSFSEHHPAAQRMMYQIVEKLSTYWTDWLVSVSRVDLETGFKRHLATESRASVIRSGMDLARFSTSVPEALAVRKEWGFTPEDVVVVNVSCLKPQKAPLDFVRAAGAAWRQESRLGFVLVGDGELRPEVEAAAAREGLGSRLVLAGWRRDMPAVLHAADIVALSSLWEGLPRSVVQARAARKPVVATAVNGTPEAVLDGVHGFLVAPHDMAGMAARFVQLARDPALRARLGSAGPAGLEEFDQERMVDDQERLYEKLLAERSAPA